MIHGEAVEPANSGLQFRARANDSAIVPSELAQIRFTDVRDAERWARLSLEKWSGGVLEHSHSGSRSENDPFKKGITGKTIRSMHTRACRFARCIQPGAGGETRQIRAHTAHRVVHGWQDRRRLTFQVDPVTKACLVNSRKTFGDEAGALR